LAIFHIADQRGLHTPSNPSHLAVTSTSITLNNQKREKFPEIHFSEKEMFGFGIVEDPSLAQETKFLKRIPAFAGIF
jgi:hypothetical protein